MKFKFLLVFLIMLNLKNTLLANETVNLYDFSFEDIDGNQVNLEKFAGKPILIVNTASRCGFTPQYEDLQNLFINYRKSDLTIIATTSNSFNQEYSDAEDIKKKLPLKEVKKSLKKRTLTDKNRKHSPLIIVKDSILIRSDQLTKKQVLSKMSSYIDRLNNKN